MITRKWRSKKDVEREGCKIFELLFMDKLRNRQTVIERDNKKADKEREREKKIVKIKKERMKIY